MCDARSLVRATPHDDGLRIVVRNAPDSRAFCKAVAGLAEARSAKAGPHRRHDPQAEIHACHGSTRYRSASTSYPTSRTSSVERRLKQLPDGQRRRTGPLAPRLEPDQIGFLELEFGGVLDDDHSVVRGSSAARALRTVVFPSVKGSARSSEEVSWSHWWKSASLEKVTAGPGSPRSPGHWR